MSSLPHLLVVAAALYDEDRDAWLMAEHQKRDALAGLWEFPGGKVEENEVPERAIIREMEEELGIQVSEGDLQPLTFLSHSYPEYGFHLLMPVYKITKWGGEVESKLGQKLIWIPSSEFASYTHKTLPANIPVMDWIVKYEIK